MLDTESVTALEREAFEVAVGALRRYLRKHPTDTYAHSELIECCNPPRASHNRAEALEPFWRELFDDEMPPGLRRFLKAEQLQCETRQQEAKLEYRAALAHELDDCVVRHGLACTLAMLNDEAAGEEFERALAWDDSFVPSLVVYAEWLFTRGQFDKLKCICAKAANMDSARAGCFPNGAELLGRVQAIGASVQALEDTLTLAGRERWNEALLALWPGLRRHPRNCTLIRTFMYLAYRASCLDAAERRIEELHSELSPARHYAAGLARWYQDEAAEALQDYERARQYGLDHPLLLYSEGLAHLSFGRVRESRERLGNALTRAPWLVCLRSELVSLAFREGDIDACLAYADMRREHKDLAIKYEVNGAARLREMDALRARALALRNGASQALLSEVPDVQDCGYCAAARAVILAALGQVDAADGSLLTAILTRDLCSPDDLALQERRVVDQLTPGGLGAMLAQALLSRVLSTATREHLVRFLQESDSVRACMAICIASECLGDTELAEAALRAALRLDRHGQAPLRGLCRVYTAHQDADQLRLLAEQFPSSALPLAGLFSLAADRGDMEAAFDCLAKAVLVDKDARVEPGLVTDMVESGRIIDSPVALSLLNRTSPIDFRGRAVVAARMTQRQWWSEVRQILGDLIDQGYAVPHAIAYYSLACLAEQPSSR